MAEFIDESVALESTTVGVYRTSTTVKGGRRFSFSALVVVGDRSGQLGIGYAKANQVPQAIEKAQKSARRKMTSIPLQGRTIPHSVTGRFGACKVEIVPASPGTGVTAGAAVRAPLEMVGVQDCLTKAFGSTNPKNLVKAVMNGLLQLRSKEQIEYLRGVKIGTTSVEDAIERSSAMIAPPSGAPPAVAPVGLQAKPGRGKSGRGQRGRRKKADDSAPPQANDKADTNTPSEKTE